MAGHAPSALSPAISGLLSASVAHSVLGQFCHKVLPYTECRLASLYGDHSVFPADSEQTTPSSAGSPEEKAALRCLLDVSWAQPPISSYSLS